MMGPHHASSGLTLLVLVTSASFLHLSASSPLSNHEDGDDPHDGALPGPAESGNGGVDERSSIQREQAEDEEELFKDVDPRKLAAVLLEALNRSQVERRMEEDGRDDAEEETKAERREVQKDEVSQERVDRHRDGRQELELLMASQAKDRDEEEERRKALEEEEKLTERVTSHTTSQMVQTRTEQNPNTSAGAAERGATQQPGPTNPEEEEEQLSPEELKSLETMMKEFPRLNAKRDEGLEQKQRESRAFSSFNDINPSLKGSELAWSKKKLKWQEETQKALHFPLFPGGRAEEGRYTAPPQPPADQEVTGGNDLEEDEDEPALSPEEEEAQAREEQEEMIRQAAEARKAKMEEEKLADIASDMLLRYMGKQNHGNRKFSPAGSSAAEDKRSDEEQELAEENDIDPQTIDKLIEISSKLHLPADDVVDIITDVEKKKRKDVPPEVMSLWQHPPPISPLSSSFFPTNQNAIPVSRQPSPDANVLKTWFQDRHTPKPEDFQNKLPKPLLASLSFWPKAKPLLVKQDRRLKSSRPVWTGYPFYPYTYPSFPQRNPLPDYYPVYLPPVRRPKHRYFIPKPAPPLSNFMDDSFTLSPNRRYHSWVPPQLRKPPAGLQRKPFHSRYPISKAWPPPQSLIPARQRPFSEPAVRPSGSRIKDEELEKLIQLLLMERPQRMD
ncbi:neurosecretory protein VGF [Cololabis saira]|uniref:neurosecretory protein VGF n=1 Tax=Cololabis saira TaxID=129043 RepID=UPI002AD2FF74|nr:neurosecretory protein VGF [Cololabis saira]